MRTEKPAKPDLNPQIQPAAVSSSRQFEPLIDSREAAALLRMHHKTLEQGFDSAVRVTNGSPLIRLEPVPIQSSGRKGRFDKHER